MNAPASNHSDRPASVLDAIQKRGTLRIAVEFGKPPESGTPPEMYIDPVTGKPAGIAPMISQLIADDLGVKLECIDIPWPTQVQALIDGKVDLLPKHSNTPQRALIVDFANRPLVAFRVTVLISTSRPLTKSELNQKGRVIAVWHGSSTRQIAEKNFPAATVREFSDAKAEVVAGRADACVTDAVTHTFMKLNPGLAFLLDGGAPLVLSTEYGHVAIRQGDPRFLNWLNNWLEYQDGQGTLGYLCDVWWESYMAAGKVPSQSAALVSEAFALQTA